MRYNRIIFALCIAVVFTSCSQNSVTTINNSAVTWVFPSVGTLFVYQITNQDSISPAFDTITILNTGLQIKGKTNVTGYVENNGTVDTALYNIELDGDISYGNSAQYFHPNFIWQTFPTASHKPISDPLVNIWEGETRTVISDIRTFVGADNITTLGGVFSTLHVKEIVAIFDSTIDPSGDYSEKDTVVTDTWFAPEIALYVKVIDNETFGGQPQPQTETDLIKYEPK
jgi:hypothetical protein